jgi:1,4-alpha-glucan branching enzyme
VADLNHIYRSELALHQVDFDWPGFEWLEVNDNENSVFAFLRVDQTRDNCIAVVSNFTPVPRDNYRLSLPRAGAWREVLNSDAEMYGGGNLGNGGTLWAVDQPWGNQSFSAQLLLPPLSTLILKSA